MIERNSGHVVSIASAAGLFGMSRLTDYCSRWFMLHINLIWKCIFILFTSKFGAVGISEALDMELRFRKKDGVKITTVCPFYIDTGMFRGVRSRFLFIWNSFLQNDFTKIKLKLKKHEIKYKLILLFVISVTEIEILISLYELLNFLYYLCTLLRYF